MCVCVYIFIYMSYKLVLVVFFLSVLVYFSLSKAARLSNALTSSAGFGLCSYFFLFFFSFQIYLFIFYRCQAVVLKAASKCAKVQFYFLFISCFLIGKWEQLCPGNKSRLFAYCVVIGLCVDGLAKSRRICVLIGYAN